MSRVIVAAEMSAAYFHDLAHLEVGLRNAYDRALLNHLYVAGQLSTELKHFINQTSELPELIERKP